MSSNKLCPDCQDEMVPVVYAHRTETLDQMEQDGLLKLASCMYLGYPNRPTLFCNICRNTVWRDGQYPQNFIDH
jgi:hypothetical protein